MPPPPIEVLSKTAATVSANMESGTLVSGADLDALRTNVEEMVKTPATQETLRRIHVRMTTYRHLLEFRTRLGSTPETERKDIEAVRTNLDELSKTLTAQFGPAPAPAVPLRADTSFGFKAARAEREEQVRTLVKYGAMGAAGIALIVLLGKAVKSLGGLATGNGVIKNTTFLGLLGGGIYAAYRYLSGRSPEGAKKTAEETKKLEESRKKVAEELTKLLATLPEGLNLLAGAHPPITVGGITLAVGGGNVLVNGQTLTAKFAPIGTSDRDRFWPRARITEVKREGESIRLQLSGHFPSETESLGPAGRIVSGIRSFLHLHTETTRSILLTREQFAAVLTSAVGGERHRFNHTEGGRTNRISIGV